MKTAWLLIAALLVSADAAAQTLPRNVRAAADRITAAQLQRDLEYFSSDALKGRDTFSPGFDSAANYIVDRLKRAGLEPFGDNGTWFQHYDVAAVMADTAQLYLDAAGKRFLFGDILFAAPPELPYSATLPVVYVGHGWRVPSQGIDAYAGVDVANKIVIMHADSTPGGVPRSTLPADAVPPLRAAQLLGAAGVITIADPRAEQWTGMLQNRRLRSFEDLDPYVPSAYGRRGRGIRIVAKPELLAALQQDGRVTPGATVSINVPVATRTVRKSYNIVARIPGSDPALAHEIITVAAHLDGAVGTTPVAGDSIYNAADDNATGSAGTLAVAEQLARLPRPRRSIVFIWDSGEEIGLYGTRSFVGKQHVPLKDIITHFNIDMIGATRAPGTTDSASVDVVGPNEVYMIGPRVLSTAMDSLIRQTNRDLLNMKLNDRYDVEGNEFFYPRTDASPFLERGVLTVGFFTGIHPRYHRPADEARYLDPKKIEAVSRTVLGVLWTLANVPQAPTIDKPIPQRVTRYDDE